MLSNLETDKEKLIQIVLVGQSEFAELLAAQALRQLNERITVRYQLKSLDRQDVQHYVQHRLVVAGGRGNVRFTKGALRAIYAYSGGIPRRINVLCDRALLVAYCNDEFTISRNTVLGAVDDIQSDFSQIYGKGQWFRRRPVLAAAAMLVGFIVASIGGWNLREQIPGLFSAVEKVAVVQSKTFVPRPVEFEKTDVVQKAFVRKPIEAQIESASLALDQRASLRGLFKLFDVQEAESTFATGEVYPALFSFEGYPELYRILTKPFRLRIKSDSEGQARYLLIQEVTAGGAVALDAEGNKWPVTEDFVLAHWDGEISWLYPYEHGHEKLTKWMGGFGVLKVQQILQQMGYSVEPRGLYDSTTFNEVMRFQRDFGLEADGIVDARTRALLYQMSG
jgi:general secretion pathway protein A